MIDINDWRHYSETTLMDFIKLYDNNPQSLRKVEEAYGFAYDKHKNQRPRASGEPYITHPVAAANFLAIMRMDIDSICAGLLHDTLEDTDATYPEIRENFGEDVANLVAGVTKLNRCEDMDLDSLRMQIDVNDPTTLYTLTLKNFVDSMLYDPRTPIIKGAGDRNHNMLTVGYKTPIKQQEKSRETLEVYAPLMNWYGIYRVQQLLEDTSFKHLSQQHSYLYNKILMRRNRIKAENKPFLDDILQSIIEEIRKNIKVVGHYDSADMKRKSEDELLYETILVGDKLSRSRIKHVYGIYDAFRKMMPEGKDEFSYVDQMVENEEDFEKIHDLRVVKLIMKDEISCWMARMILCDMFPPIDKYQHNYIANPKSNMYQSFHETVSIDGHLVQFQIRTEEQEHRNTYGFAWELYKYQGENTRERILEAFKKYPIYSRLVALSENEEIQTLNDYRHILDSEVLNVKEITVTDRNTGRARAIKEGSTIHDFAYLIAGHDGDHLSKAIVNDTVYTFRSDEYGNIDFSFNPFYLKLQQGDEIYVEFDENINCPKPNSDFEPATSKKLSNTPGEVKE